MHLLRLQKASHATHCCELISSWNSPGGQAQTYATCTYFFLNSQSNKCYMAEPIDNYTIEASSQTHVQPQRDKQNVCETKKR